MATIGREFQATAAAITALVTFFVALLRFANPHQCHDRILDGSCQALPVCDQFAECRILPAHFRPATKCRLVTTFRTYTYEKRAEGAIPAASIACVASPLIANTYVCRGRG